MKREIWVYLTFPILEKMEGIIHGFSTRLGGVSQGDVGSMNLSYSREPSRENVRENHRRLAEALGYEPEKYGLVGSDPYHSCAGGDGSGPWDRL